MAWACPHCGSTDLFIYYSERRAARIDQTFTEEPMPDVGNSELVEGAEDITIHCERCKAVDIEAVQKKAKKVRAKKVKGDSEDGQ